MNNNIRFTKNYIDNKYNGNIIIEATYLRNLAIT